MMKYNIEPYFETKPAQIYSKTWNTLASNNVN